MKKIIIVLVLIALVCAVAVVTCPDKQAHQDAIMSVVNEKINDELQTEEADLQALSAWVGSLGSTLASSIVDNRLTVKNHFLWSSGEFKDLEGNSSRVSVGVFGHVFTFDREDLDRAMEEMAK